MRDANVKPAATAVPDTGDTRALDLMKVVEGLGKGPDLRPPPPPEEEIPEDEIKFPTMLP